MPTSTTPHAAVPDVSAIAAEIGRVLVHEHPGLGGEVVVAVVYQAAGELLGRSRIPADFGLLLRRRAEARLAAMGGVFTPIRAD